MMLDAISLCVYPINAILMENQNKILCLIQRIHVLHGRFQFVYWWFQHLANATSSDSAKSNGLRWTVKWCWVHFINIWTHPSLVYRQMNFFRFFLFQNCHWMGYRCPPMWRVTWKQCFVVLILYSCNSIKRHHKFVQKFSYHIFTYLYVHLPFI